MQIPRRQSERPFSKVGNPSLGVKTDPSNQHVEFICLLEGCTECNSYFLHLSITFLISRAYTTFTINYSTISFGTQQSQTREILAGLRLYKGTDLLLSPLLQFLSSPPAGKARGTTQRKRTFFKSHLPSADSTDHSGFSIISEWRRCGLMEVSAELLTSKVSNTLERPASSKGPKGRKNSIAVKTFKTFNQISGNMGSILSSFINHSLTLYPSSASVNVYGEVFPISDHKHSAAGSTFYCLFIQNLIK